MSVAQFELAALRVVPLCHESPHWRLRCRVVPRAAARVVGARRPPPCFGRARSISRYLDLLSRSSSTLALVRISDSSARTREPRRSPLLATAVANLRRARHLPCGSAPRGHPACRMPHPEHHPGRRHR